MQHYFNLSIGGPTFNNESTAISSGECQPFDQQRLSLDVDFSGTVSTCIGQRNLSRIERSILRRAGNVHYPNTFLDDTDKVIIDFRGVGLLDFSFEPVWAFKGML